MNDGNSGNNYAYTFVTDTTSTINPYAVNLTGSRAYDGTLNVAAGALTIGTLVGTETLTLSGTGTVADKNVGALKPVTLGSLALGDGLNGGLASNYTFTGATQTADITRAPLGIAANSTSKIYGNTLSFTGTEFSSTGLKNSETIGSVSLASAGAVSTAGVAGGPYAITASAATGGTFNAGNYTISLCQRCSERDSRAAGHCGEQRDATLRRC